jgi:hypothetical protein
MHFVSSCVVLFSERGKTMEIVNGYSCRNCTDVSYAKKNIDPAHPKDGPAGASSTKEANRRNFAVELGGALAGLGLQAQGLREQGNAPELRSTVGTHLNVLA